MPETVALDAAVETELTRLVQLAIIAQVQAWEAQNNLQAILDTHLVAGSPEWCAAQLHVTEAVAEMACDPDKPLPELLADATTATLLDTLRSLAAARQEAADA